MQHMRFLSLHPQQNLVSSDFLILFSQVSIKWYLIRGLNLHFSISNKVLNLFMCLCTSGFFSVCTYSCLFIFFYWFLNFCYVIVDTYSKIYLTGVPYKMQQQNKPPRTLYTTQGFQFHFSVIDLQGVGWVCFLFFNNLITDPLLISNCVNRYVAQLVACLLLSLQTELFNIRKCYNIGWRVLFVFTFTNYLSITHCFFFYIRHSC